MSTQLRGVILFFVPHKRESSRTTLPAQPAGHQSLLKWAITRGEDRIIGVEWAGSYGAGLTRHLLDAGEDVYEVPAFLSHRERTRNPSRGEERGATRQSATPSAKYTLTIPGTEGACAATRSFAIPPRPSVVVLATFGFA